MKYLSTLLLAAISLVAAQSECPTRCVRKEVRSLTGDERSKYFNALRTVMRSGRYDELTDLHIRYTGQIHSNPAFFPAHRAMLRELEKALQAVDSSVCLHYWSWDVDSQNPAASPIFTSDFYYSDANGGCVSSEFLGGWQPSHPNRHCLRRAFDASGSLSALTGPEVLNSIIARTTDYDSFRQRIEGSPHSNVHVNVGGDMAIMASPNDPLFYAHHTFIDKLWWNWQQVRGNIRLYTGTHWSGNRRVSPEDSLEPFPYTVNQVFDIGSLCYSYEEFQGAAQRASAQSLPVATIQSANDGQPITLENVSEFLSNVHFFSSTAAPAATDGIAHAAATVPLTTTTVDTTVAADDKYNLVYLRTPKPLPAEWIQMNNLTEATIRQHEQEYATIITQLNSIGGYVSPCALLHRPDLLVVDVNAKKVDKYVCPVNGKGKLEISLQGEGSQAVSNVLAAVRKVAPEVQGDVSKLREQVVALVGEPVMDKKSASNFLTSQDEKETIPIKRGQDSSASALRTSLYAAMAVLMVHFL